MGAIGVLSGSLGVVLGVLSVVLGGLGVVLATLGVILGALEVALGASWLPIPHPHNPLLKRVVWRGCVALCVRRWASTRKIKIRNPVLEFGVIV